MAVEVERRRDNRGAVTVVPEDPVVVWPSKSRKITLVAPGRLCRKKVWSLGKGASGGARVGGGRSGALRQELIDIEEPVLVVDREIAITEEQAAQAFRCQVVAGGYGGEAWTKSFDGGLAAMARVAGLRSSRLSREQEAGQQRDEEHERRQRGARGWARAACHRDLRLGVPRLGASDDL